MLVSSKVNIEIAEKAKKIVSARKRKGKLKKQNRVRDGIIYPTAERKRHTGGFVQTMEFDEAKSNAKVPKFRVRYECCLDEYLSKRVIEIGEYDAGMKFRKAWLMRTEGIVTKDSLTSLPGNGTVFDPMVQKSWAERVLHEAHSSAELSIAQHMMVVKVCGMDEAAGQGGAADTLRRGLDKLARFWGFV